MTQPLLPESSSPADTAELNSGESETKKPNPVESFHQSYLVGGPHGRLRTQLLWVNRLLAYDEKSSVSVISLRDLGRALSAFQQEVRVQRVPPEPGAGASPSRSRIQTGPRSSVRRRTRNFKN